MTAPFTNSGVPIPVVVINQTGNVPPVSGAVTATQSGAWSVAVSGSVAVTGTFWQATQPVSAASLPLPAGAATSAKQPVLGTAGAPSSDVLSVQGKASMTPLLVDPSGVTSPVSIIAPVAVTGTFWQATQPVSIASPNNLATSQVSVGMTATLIAASRAGRLGIIIENLGAVDIYIGNSGVTITTGALLRGVAGTAMSFLFNGAIYGIVAAGTQSVSIAEVY